MGAFSFFGEDMKFSVRSALTLAVLSTNAFALDLKGHQFTDAYRYSLLEDTSVERFDGKNIFLGSYAFVKSPFYTTNKNVSKVSGDIIKYNNVVTLGYSHYFNDSLTMGLDVAAIQNKVLGDSYTSFADTNLRGKYLLTGRGQDFALSINPYLTLPTGKRENFTTARSMTGGARVVGEKHSDKWHYIASAGYGHAPKNNFVIVDQRNLLLTQLGVSYDFATDWNANFEMTRNFTLSSDDRQDEGDYFVTAKNRTTDRLSLYGGAGLAGLQTAERRQYTVFVGFKWSDAEDKVAPPKPVERPVEVKTVYVPVEAPKTRDEEKGFGTLIGRENIYFANGSHATGKDEKAKAMKIVTAWKKLGEKISKIVVEGYASKRGNPEKNEVLARKRTDQVTNILIDAGVPASLIVSVSYGDNALQDPEEWKNRKVQFRVYKKKETPQ